MRVNLRWGPVDRYVYDQWVDLAWYDEAGHAKRVTTYPITGPVNSVDWPGLLPASTYYVRVNQRSFVDSVSESPIFVFRTALCSSTQPGEIVNLPGSRRISDGPASDNGANDEAGNDDEGDDDSGDEEPLEDSEDESDSDSQRPVEPRLR